MWSEPYVDIKFSGSHKDMRSRHFAPSETVLLRCEVEISTRYVPLVTWFHNPDRSLDNNGPSLLVAVNTVKIRVCTFAFNGQQGVRRSGFYPRRWKRQT